MENGINEKYQALTKVVRQLVNLVVGLFLLVLTLFAYLLYIQPQIIQKPDTKNLQTLISPSANNTSENKEKYWQAPDTSSLTNLPERDLILYGRDLIAKTSNYFGPEGVVKKNATNGMNCQNCHLDAGTRVFGNNYSAVFATYPKYRPRSGTSEDIFKRVNDCFERSLNGEPLTKNSKEMKAIIAYINWLGKDVPKGEKSKGSGLKDLPLLDRAADPVKGKLAYTQKCITCHQENGQGLMNPDKTAYTYPPLWGPNSYNIGAGLYRLASFAKYAKYNMPLGATHNNPQLSDEEAWDIAAYVNSQSRPSKDISKDWPKIAEKPFDHPFGPFADGFDEQQHKYGPFQPIKDKASAMK